MGDSLLIENGTLLLTGAKPAVLPGHSLLIEDGYIRRIAPRNRLTDFRGKRLDASGKVVMPGLINAHTHFYSTFARGLARIRPSRDFQQVLRNLWWRLDSALTPEDCYYSALVPLLESIRHGTTTLLDHHASPNAVLGSLSSIQRAVKASGLRACLCYEVSDRDGADVAKRGLEENASFIRACRRDRRGEESKDPGTRFAPASLPVEATRPRGGNASSGKGRGRCTSMAAPEPAAAPLPTSLFGLHASFTLKNSTLETAAALGSELGSGFHIHVAEAESDQADARRRCGRRTVERLNDFGILGPHTVAAHCVHVNRNEMRLLAETGTWVAHNPQSNLNNAVGIADIVSLDQRGVRVGLGTDAMTTNMLEELRVALWAQHLGRSNPSAGFTEVVNALFVNNPELARTLFGLPIGELREGAVGDVVLLDYDPPTPLAAGNLYGHMLFGLSQAAVDTTIVGGRVLMRNRRLLLNLDEERINARARELARNLWKKL